MSTTPAATPLSEAEYAEVARFGLDKPEPLDTLNAHMIRFAESVKRAMQSAVVEHQRLLQPPTRTSPDWAERKGIYVLDASGWDRSTPAAFDASWGKKITETDFDHRAGRSLTAPRADVDLTAHAPGRVIR
jgi:hypothetical protein